MEVISTMVEMYSCIINKYTIEKAIHLNLTCNEFYIMAQLQLHFECVKEELNNILDNVPRPDPLSESKSRTHVKDQK